MQTLNVPLITLLRPYRKVSEHRSVLGWLASGRWAAGTEPDIGDQQA